jgi:hypothetical protein
MWVASFTPQPLYSRRKALGHRVDESLGGFQCQFGHCGERTISCSSPKSNPSLSIIQLSIQAEQSRLHLRKRGCNIWCYIWQSIYSFPVIFVNFCFCFHVCLQSSIKIITFFVDACIINPVYGSDTSKRNEINIKWINISRLFVFTVEANYNRSYGRWESVCVIISDGFHLQNTYTITKGQNYMPTGYLTLIYMMSFRKVIVWWDIHANEDKSLSVYLQRIN